MASSTLYEAKKEELRLMYKRKDVSQKSLAIQELAVWNQYKALVSGDGSRLPQKRDHFFAENFPMPFSLVSVRLSMLRLGEWATFFWEKTESGLRVRKAYELSLKAKKFGLDAGVSYSEASHHVWEEYQASGKKIGRPRVYDGKSVGDTGEYGKSFDPDVSNSRRFKAALKKLTAYFVHSRLEDLESSVQQELIDEFEYEVRVSYEDLLKKIVKHRKYMKEDAAKTLSMGAVRRACECLDLPSPKNGVSIDIAFARSRFKKLASRFHPDKTGNNPKLTRQFHDINDAWEVIQKYNECLEIE